MLTQDFPLHTFLRNYTIAALTVALLSLGLSRIHATSSQPSDRLDKQGFTKVINVSNIYAAQKY